MVSENSFHTKKANLVLSAVFEIGFALKLKSQKEDY
jgi:hypothetical protein